MTLRIHGEAPNFVADTTEGKIDFHEWIGNGWAILFSHAKDFPDEQIKAMPVYPMSSGRNFEEVLRLVDSCQLTAKHEIATPANWKTGRRGDHRAVGLRRRRQGGLPQRLARARAAHAHRPAAALSEYGRGARPLKSRRKIVSSLSRPEA